MSKRPWYVELEDTDTQPPSATGEISSETTAEPTQPVTADAQETANAIAESPTRLAPGQPPVNEKNSAIEGLAAAVATEAAGTGAANSMATAQESPSATPRSVGRLRTMLQRHPWLGAVATLLLATVTCAAALRSIPDISSNCASWLPTHGQTPWQHGGVPAALVAGLQKLGLGPSGAWTVAQLLAGTLICAGTLLAAARLAGWGAWAIAAILLAIWPAGRAMLTTSGPETWIALGTLLVLHAGLALPKTPRRAALLLAAAVLLLALAHPLALAWLLPAWLVVTVVPNELVDRHADHRLGPRLVPHWPAAVAGLTLGLGLVLLVLPLAVLKPLVLSFIHELRTPTPCTVLGRLPGWPVLGPLLVWLAQLPVVVLLLALSAGLQVRRKVEQPLALPVILIGLWLLLLAVVGLPVPGDLDGLPVMVPLLTVVAATQACRLLRPGAKYPSQLSIIEHEPMVPQASRLALTVVAVCALVALGADSWLGQTDRRNAVASHLGLLARTEPLQPAVLSADDLELLRRFPDSTAILPAQIGGAKAGLVAKALYPELGPVSYGPPYASHQILLPAVALNAIDATFMSRGKVLACNPRHCLLRLRGQND